MKLMQGKVRYLLITVMILAVLSSNTEAAELEQDIAVGPNNPHIITFTVDTEGKIYAETQVGGDTQELCLRLEFVQTGEMKKEAWGGSGKLLTLSYDISDEDLEKGNEWTISVASGNGDGKGYLWVEYPQAEPVPSDENVPAVNGIPPTAHMKIYPNPAGEGESVTFKGYGTDIDGEVVLCRWTFPDGTTLTREGSSYTEVADLRDLSGGTYRFAVQDDSGLWSEEVSQELILEEVTDGEDEGLDLWGLVLAAALAVAVAFGILKVSRKSRKKKAREEGTGSIHATSDPESARVYLDGAYIAPSPAEMDGVPAAEHLVTFRKFGYIECKKGALVKDEKATSVHCDLQKMPQLKMELSADPTMTPADGRSRSVITVTIQSEDGIPIHVPEDVTVDMETSMGTIDSPVTIKKGHASTRSFLTSSTSAAVTKVKARCEPIPENSIAIEFTDTE
ncbi:MAG: PEGA domain-containing protein [Methanosarcinaceae archaeon]|nr:PEGA domain-containing protein [Methanosarcinaceae archaeon]